MVAWSGLYDNVFSDGPYALYINKPSIRKKIGKMLRRQGWKADRQMMDDAFEALSTGLTQSAVTHARVQAVSGVASLTNLGGVRTIETRTITAGGSTDATDETNMEQITTLTSKPSSYPVDASGNGGGNKAGF